MPAHIIGTLLTLYCAGWCLVPGAYGWLVFLDIVTHFSEQVHCSKIYVQFVNPNATFVINEPFVELNVEVRMW